MSNAVEVSMTDIHCHLLPSVDDGAKDMDTALLMARMAVERGVDTMIATPHCNLPDGGMKNYRSAALSTCLHGLQKEIADAGLPLTVLPGAEIMCTPDVPELLQSGKLPTLTDSNYLLAEVSVRNTEQAALKGVTATDNRDGDLTDDIIIQGITQPITDDTAKITYAVFDSANNMSTYQRTIRYTDHKKPHFSMTKPLIYGVGEPITVLDRLSAKDSSGKDLTDNIHITSQNIYLDQEGTYTITVQIANSMGDVESLTLPVIITSHAAAYNCVKLFEYITCQDKGARFDPYHYISKVIDMDGDSDTSDNVTVDSDVDTDVPGVYEVRYTYQSYTVCQTVIVK